MVMFLYEQIANDIERLIDRRTLQPGDRAPSVRHLSRQRGVSISTVTQAYLELEARGLLEARPRSGFYISMSRRRAIPAPACSAPLCDKTAVTSGSLISDFMRHLRNPDFVPLGCAVPFTGLFPMNQLQRLTAQMNRAAPERNIQYEFPPGNRDLRRQLAARTLAWEHPLDQNDFVITAGCSDALTLSLRALTKPGDTVAIESPTYYGFLQAIENLGLMALEIPTESRAGADIDVIERFLIEGKTKVVMLSSNCSNPMGAIMPEENKRRLAALLKEHDATLIEDEIYGDVYFGAERPRPVKSFDVADRVVLCSSFSKTLVPGFRIGWVASHRLHERICELQFMSTVAASSLPQATVAAFLTGNRYDRHIQRLRRSFAAAVSRYSDAIAEFFPEGTCVSSPQGGFVIWVSLPEGADALRVFEEALEHKISIAPGPIFSPRKGYRDCIRISAGYPWTERIEHAIAELAEIVKRQTD